MQRIGFALPLSLATPITIGNFLLHGILSDSVICHMTMWLDHVSLFLATDATILLYITLLCILLLWRTFQLIFVQDISIDYCAHSANSSDSVAGIFIGICGSDPVHKLLDGNFQWTCHGKLDQGAPEFFLPLIPLCAGS